MPQNLSCAAVVIGALRVNAGAQMLGFIYYMAVKLF